ncbi:MAG TPA: DUF3488 and transglutaminase-like domain-containing protein [Longimicrobiales bacterium]|nr:DUF3488 and transglutaminase-like domain-containing protein [Longimicrobiales bacterium]
MNGGLRELHHRLSALLGLIALAVFISGAGLDAPTVIPAAVALLAALLVRPGEAWLQRAEPFWRIAALVFAARALYLVLNRVGDPVLPMVDMLLLLLCAEAWRRRDGSGDARHFALTFALLVASAAYRPGPAFGVLFIAYVLCAIVLLAVGHLFRESLEHGVAAPAPSRTLLARMTVAAAAVLIVSAGVFVFFPRASQGWAARVTPPVAGTIMGFSDRVSLGQHGTRIAPNPEVVMRVEFPDGPPADVRGLHWRGLSYNAFDGVAWSRSRQLPFRRVDEAQVWGGPVVEQVVHARRLTGSSVLFGLHPVMDVTPLSPIRPVRVRNGDILYRGDADPSYRVRSRAQPPPAAELRQVVNTHTPESQVYLQLPAMTPRMMRLADSLRVSAPTMYDHVIAVERYLRTQFGYTLDLPATRRETSLDHFLFVRREGHCEYFSTAMAVLLRAGGIATRNVNGFLGGEWNEFGRFLSVTQNNAHSWVEVWFPGHGWVPFDPTPPAAAAAAIASAGAGGTGPLRMLLDGLNYRWGRWVLDYDVRTQSSMLDRFAGRSPAGPAPDGAPGSAGRVLVWVGSALGILLVLVLIRRGALLLPGHGASAASRSYAAVRKAWARAGYGDGTSQTPLALAEAVAGAPGGHDVRRVVELYVAARFGGVALTPAEQEELRQAASRARAAARRLARTVRPD